MANSVKILIETLYKGQGVKQATDDLEQINAKSQSLDKGLGTLAGTFGLVAGGAVALGAALNKALDIAAEGARIERLETSFQTLASVAGASGDEIFESLDRAARGTVASSDLILSANRAMMLGLGADADQLGKLMEIAAFRGRAMGLTTTQAFNDIVTGIGRTSPMILDNLGIMTKGWTEEAAAAGVAFDAQFVLNKVLEDGGKQLEEVGGLVDDTAASYERLDANMKNATESGKKQLGEFLQPLADAWNRTMDAQERANQLVAEGVPPQVALSVALSETANATEQLQVVEDDIIDTRRESIDSLRDQGTAIEDNTDALKDQSGAYKDLLGSMSSINTERERFAEKSQDLKDKEKEIQDAITRENLAYGELLSTGEQTQDQIDAHITKNDELIKKLEENRQAQEKLTQDTVGASEERIYQTIEEGLAKDGLTQKEFEFLQNYQVQQGLIAQADADRAIAERAAAEQVISDFERQNAVMDTTQAKLDALVNGSPYNVKINIETIGSIPTISSNANRLSGSSYRRESVFTRPGYLGGYAEGGSFVVPGTGAGDRPYMVGLTPGERVTVTPKGDGGGVNVNINIANIRALSDIDYLVQEVQRRIG